MSSPDRHVSITGFGLVTPLGLSAWETFRALLDGKVIPDRIQSLPEHIGTIETVQLAGSVRLAEHGAADPSIELAERAAREALGMAGVQPGNVTGILGASKGAMHALVDAIRKPGDPDRFGMAPRITDAQRAVTLGPHGYLAEHLSRRLGLGPVRSIVAACASSLIALHHAAMSIQPGQPVLVMTSESALLPMFISSYDRLGVLPPLNVEQYRGRPLDQNRSGFMLSEIGAAVVLEATEQAPAAGSIELLETAIANDSEDLIRNTADLPALTRIATQLLQDRHVDVIHPHATGTQEHDTAELNVYERLGCDADLYAVKGAIGHGLGASGLTSLVIACLCARAGRRPPMPWIDTPIETSLPINSAVQVRPMATHAVFAAGFGGHTAGVVIQRH